MKYIYTILISIVFALVGKSFGRYLAKTHLTDDTSAILTVAAHRAALKKVGIVAAVVFAIWLLMISLSSFVARWINIVGWLPLIALNCCLAFLAGTSASLAALLSRPFRWDAIDILIKQREKLIDYLKRFIPVLVIAVLLSTGPALAADACLIALDPTPSVNVADLTDAKQFLAASILEAASAFECRRMVTINVGCEVRHAKRVWLDVPVASAAIDCSKVEPDPLTGHSRFWDLVRGVADYRKKEAVARCEQEQAGLKRAYEADRSTFLAAFRSSLYSNEHPRCSRIADLVRDGLESGLYRAIIITTDTIDNPPASLDGIVVPPGAHVVVIVTRINPAYAHTDADLARAADWARLAGVTVVTTAELRPGYWGPSSSGGAP